MDASFLGSGWGFPVAADAEGRIAGAAYEESIRQAIWIILGTSPGERLMRPDFGCGLHELVFAPGNATTVGTVMQRVRDALVRWEPRIDVLGVEVLSDRATPAELRISIDYRVRTTNNQFNLVYPFYLERSAP
jgi:uncharacterized protein